MRGNIDEIMDVKSDFDLLLRLRLLRFRASLNRIWGFHGDTQHTVHTRLKEEERGDVAKGMGGLGVSNNFFFLSRTR